jgi:hypothetical protein
MLADERRAFDLTPVCVNVYGVKILRPVTPAARQSNRNIEAFQPVAPGSQRGQFPVLQIHYLTHGFHECTAKTLLVGADRRLRARLWRHSINANARSARNS